jgi:GTPase
MNKRCGVIVLLGSTNVGKSTLVNKIVGNKISIITPKVQTTRTIIRGIATIDETQLIFLDTPGIFKPRTTLEKSMVKIAWSSIEGADTLAVLLDCKKGACKSTHEVIEKLKATGKSAILLLNKCDLIRKEALLPLMEEMGSHGVFEEIFPISALKGYGLKELMDYLIKKAPESPWHYPEDEITTASTRFLASEITREKLFYALNKELPYNLTVETESIEERKDGSIKINQVVIANTQSHKKIILGKTGSMIKMIGTKSRKELEKILGTKIHLFLHVKVRENWMDNPDIYANF